MNKRYWETRDAVTGALVKEYYHQRKMAEELGITTDAVKYAIQSQKVIEGNLRITAVDPKEAWIAPPELKPARKVTLPSICHNCPWKMHPEDTPVCAFRRCVEGYGWLMDKEANPQ